MESSRDDKPKITNSNFDENRRRIQEHFLKSAVEEFHTAQGNYHRNMGKIVRGFDAVKNKFPDETRHIINELLQPYRILTKNPFRPPTGNVRNDLESILITITNQNEEFKKTLNASLEAISNLEKFNAVLKECESKQEVVEELNNNLESERKSMLNVAAVVSQPLPQVMQYPLLVRNIEKNLPSEMSVSNENLVQEFQNTMSVLQPQIQTINENKDDLIFLNKVEDLLKNLLAAEIAKEEAEEQHNPEPDGNTNISDGPEVASPIGYGSKLRHKIEAVLVSVNRGRAKILDDSQDALSLHQGILDLLKDLQNQYENSPDEAGKSLIASATSYASSAGYYLLKLPVMFFSYNNGTSNEQKTNPLAKPELNKVILELTRFIEMKELAQAFIAERFIRPS